MENSRNKQLMTFKLRTILSSVIKSLAVLLILPRMWTKSSLCPVCIPAEYHTIHPFISHLVALLIIRLTVPVSQCCVQVTLILLNNGPRAIHITFITVYCYVFYCIITVPNLWIKLYHRYMYRKKHSIGRVWYYVWFQVSTKVLGMYSLWIRGGIL